VRPLLPFDPFLLDAFTLRVCLVFLASEKQRKEEIEAEARETERRRNLTDEERAAEDRYGLTTSIIQESLY
jgi:hypothetical protein